MNTALAIETQHLSKFYGALHAVDAVDLRVARGEIYGFLGLNGAGKTTTIRALLGMVRPSEGAVKILGQAVGPNGRGPWRRVGHMVEAPAAYPELTVRENLEIARRLQGIADQGVTDRIIERLSLGAYAGRKAGVLSTGNLQRLGLARALLHEPELLILDEPANGLDPAGVVEVRELLVGLVREKGMTVFMSSHILTEVDRLATRIGIIHRGHLLQELEADQIETLRARRLEIQARPFEQAQSVLARAGYTVKASDQTLCLSEAKAIDAPDEVAALLVQAGVALTHLAVHQEDLEAYFLRLTGEKS
jgi:ABC-2 type transport system ATP-binding protein